MADEEGNEDEEATEEGEGAEGEEGEGEAKGGKKGKRLLLIGILAVLLLGVPPALYFAGLLDSLIGKDKKQTEEVVEGEEVEEDIPVEEMVEVYYDMDEFLVNLNSNSKQPSFLKMKVALELIGEDAAQKIEIKMPKIRDNFQVYLRELRAEDLRGSAGIYRLREELLLRLNKVVYPLKVRNILFKEILVQ